MSDAITCKDLWKKYGDFAAVHDLDLHIEQGEIYGFLGPNGAGKTSTILMLLGIERPTSGQIFLFGQSLRENYFEIKQRIGTLGEHQYFYDDMTAREYLNFFAELYRVEDREQRIESLLEMVDDVQHRTGAALEGGVLGGEPLLGGLVPEGLEGGGFVGDRRSEFAEKLAAKDDEVDHVVRHLADANSKVPHMHRKRQVIHLH